MRYYYIVLFVSALFYIHQSMLITWPTINKPAQEAPRPIAMPAMNPNIIPVHYHHVCTHAAPPVVEPNFFDEFQKRLSSWWRNSLVYANKNRQVLLAGLSTGSLLASAYSIRSTRLQLLNQNLWSLWKYDALTGTYIPIDDQELIEEIQTRYFNINKAMDFMGPCRMFFDDVAQEASLLNTYSYCANFFHKLQLSICIDQALANSITQRLHRIDELKKLCIGWISKAKSVAGQ